jgi:hypothetical protein
MNKGTGAKEGLACATGQIGGAFGILACVFVCVRGHQEMILNLRSEDRSV